MEKTYRLTLVNGRAWDVQYDWNNAARLFTAGGSVNQTFRGKASGELEHRLREIMVRTEHISSIEEV